MKLNVESVTDLYWTNANHTSISCQVKFAEFEKVLPFCATPNDSEEHGRFIFEQATSGAYGAIAEKDIPVQVL